MNQLVGLLKMMVLITVFCASTIYVTTELLASYSRDRSIYLAASLDKEHLLDSVQSPRIVFVGGSNLALGINSELLSEKTGYYVINMGLHGGLGLDFVLNEVKPKVRPKDIIVLSIEHFLDKPDKKLLTQLIDVNPKVSSMLRLSFIERAQLAIFNLQRSMSSSYYELIKRQKDPNFYREAFTKHGDLISHFGKPKPVYVSGSIVFPMTDYRMSIHKINTFIVECQRKGALVFFMFPVYQKSAYELNKNTLMHLARQYQTYLKCPILGNVTTSILDDKYFFNSVYHLDSVGVQKRTKIVLDLLQNAHPKINFYSRTEYN